MDDFLESFKITDEAIEHTTCIKETLQKGGFNLTKIFCNDSSFSLIKKTEGGKALTQRIRGKMWNVKTTPSYLGNPI